METLVQELRARTRSAHHRRGHENDENEVSDRVDRPVHIYEGFSRLLSASSTKHDKLGLQIGGYVRWK
jgi:hypothetical protein